MKRRWWSLALVAAMALSAGVSAQSNAEKPLPGVRALMLEVAAHQKELDKVRESYAYTSFQTKQDIDKQGRVKKTETEEHEDFFVNGHIIERTVKRNGQPLAGGDLDKETKRVTKLVEKAENTPRDQRLEGPSITISRILDLMEAHNERRVVFRGRPTIVFDFVGRKNVKTHGLAEDASKKLAGTLWIDEADRQVARMEVRFDDDFRVAGGLFAKVEKGSNFSFEQAPQQDGLWLPTGGEGFIQARVLLLKGIRQHIMERDYGFKRFRVETVEKPGTGKRE